MTIKDHILVINGKRVDYRPSPNRGGIITPQYIIIHYTAAKTANSAINWMLSKTAQVSAHLHIARDGSVVQLVPFNIKAWHAGLSAWNGLTGLNSYSIGIELQNDSKEDYTPIQIDVAKDVSRLLVTQYNLKDILGHSDISPGRKVDPGDKFPMQLFKSAVFCN